MNNCVGKPFTFQFTPVAIHWAFVIGKPLAGIRGMREKYYAVEAGHTQEQVEDCQCDIVDRCDTLKEAKARARYLLTDAFQRSAEAEDPGYFDN